MRTSELTLDLLGGFDLQCDGRIIEVPLRVQRLLAVLALHARPVLRSFVAGTLWIDSDEERAQASLRSALWRLRRTVGTAVEGHGSSLVLAPWVAVDVHQMVEFARMLQGPDADAVTEIAGRSEIFERDLLPDWYDEWVLLQRERLRHIRLNALEAAARQLSAVGRYAEAVNAAWAAVTCEQLRESSRRTLVRIHMDAGNYGEALRQFGLYRDLLEQELGLAPSPRMMEMIDGVYASAERRR